MTAVHPSVEHEVLLRTHFPHTKNRPLKLEEAGGPGLSASCSWNKRELRHLAAMGAGSMKRRFDHVCTQLSQVRKPLACLLPFPFEMAL